MHFYLQPIGEFIFYYFGFFGEPLAKIEQFVGLYFLPEVCETGKNTDPATRFFKNLLLEYIRIKRL